jgi:hypothetical protein
MRRSASSKLSILGIVTVGPYLHRCRTEQGRTASALRSRLNSPNAVTHRAAGAGPLGAYRTVTREMAMQRWMTGVPEDKKDTLIPAGWSDAWADATWATDPVGAKTNPPVIRAPNGVLADGNEYWSAGKAYYDAAKITVPTLLVQAEWDRDLPPYMAQTLFPLLDSSPGKRYVMLPRAPTRSSWRRTAAFCSRQSRLSSMRQAGLSRSLSLREVTCASDDSILPRIPRCDFWTLAPLAALTAGTIHSLLGAAHERSELGIEADGVLEERGVADTLIDRELGARDHLGGVFGGDQV